MPEYTPLEAMSKKFLNRKHALTIWGRVAQFTVEPPQTFEQHDLIEEMKETHGISSAAVFEEVQRMREINAITVVSKRPHEGVVLTRTDVAAWAFMEELTRLALESE